MAAASSVSKLGRAVAIAPVKTLCYTVSRKEQPMMYLFLVWCAMAAFVLSLAMYRKFVARSEDDLVHLGEADERLVTLQKSVASRLETIDKWERVFTIVTVAFGLVVGALYLYHGWIDSAQLK
jgi:hypothetical protein